jgi:hypothetical protein
MKKFLHLCSLAFLALITLHSCQTHYVDLPKIAADPRGEIVSATLVQTLDTMQIRQKLNSNGASSLSFVQLKYSIDFYKVIYKTIDFDGNATIASGAVILPKGTPKPQGLASYQHGTVILKEDVPSRMNKESLIGMVLSSSLGLNMCSADYLGLGDSPGMHPYIVAKCEARACVDMIRSAKKLAAEKGQVLNNQLFVFGYSEGGHATMALLKELEEKHSTELPVTAAAPMAGPYDVSGYQTNVIVNNAPYPSPFYLPYILFGYNSVYKMYPSADDFLKTPFNQTLPPLFDGQHSSGTINTAMGGSSVIPNSIVRPEVLEAFRYNYQHPLRKALRDNDLYDWKPKTPMMLCHCSGDDQVDFRNTEVAYSTFLANGVSPANLRKVNPGNIKHSDCALPCLLDALDFVTGFMQL